MIAVLVFPPLIFSMSGFLLLHFLRNLHNFPWHLLHLRAEFIPRIYTTSER